MPHARTRTWLLVTALTLGACTTTRSPTPSTRQLTGTGLVTGLDGTGARGAASRKAILTHLRDLGLALTISDIVAATPPTLSRASERQDSTTNRLGTICGQDEILRPEAHPRNFLLRGATEFSDTTVAPAKQAPTSSYERPGRIRRNERVLHERGRLPA